MAPVPARFQFLNPARFGSGRIWVSGIQYNSNGHWKSQLSYRPVNSATTTNNDNNDNDDDDDYDENTR